MSRRWAWFAFTVLIVLSSGCGQSEIVPTGEAGTRMDIQISSTAFTDAGDIPQVYTCDGENLSPPLAWKSVPEEAQSLALIVDDPDAPVKVWVHWVLYDLSPRLSNLPDGLALGAELPSVGMQGKNDFNKFGYGGPCPPRGKAHRYYFTLLALDQMLNLPAGATKTELENAMKGHVIAHGQLIGKYSR